MSVIHHGKDSPEEIRQKRIDFHMNYCVHYDPPRGFSLRKDYCALGCGAVGTHEKPCIGGHNRANPTMDCPSWERRSRESAIERAERIEESFQRIEKVGPVVAAWREKPPVGKLEVIECPACGGRLHLAQSAYNGHVHGHCETKGCVSWME